MKMKIKNRSHRYDINNPRSRHGHKYSKNKKCFSMMMLICIKQHLSNIWGSIHEKVKQYWGWVEKTRCLQKKRVSGVILPERFHLNIMFVLSGPHLVIDDEVFQEALNILLCWKIVLFCPWKSPNLEAKMPPKRP